MDSICCGAQLKVKIPRPQVLINCCNQCGTLWIEHRELGHGVDLPWNSPGITPDFLQALQFRRILQAEAMIEWCGTTLRRGKILDYSCGQGVFFRTALEQGFDIYACDYQLDVKAFKGEEQKRAVQLDVPWGWPEFGKEIGTLVLLDVLEHMIDPGRFIDLAYKENVDNFIIKVPLVTGPGAGLAKLAAAVGKFEILEALLLVGDMAPHVSFFSPLGLKNLLRKHGYCLVKTLNLPEVGRELPRRNRSIKASASVKAIVAGVGSVLECTSKIWPDTAAFHFERMK